TLHVSLRGLLPNVIFSSVLKGGLEGGCLIHWFPIRTDDPLSLILRHHVISAAQGTLWYWRDRTNFIPKDAEFCVECVNRGSGLLRCG
ncbi:hypothetical protein Tco_1416355, partial [Tanacetum coccineum]